MSFLFIKQPDATQTRLAYIVLNTEQESNIERRPVTTLLLWAECCLNTNCMNTARNSYDKR